MAIVAKVLHKNTLKLYSKAHKQWAVLSKNAAIRTMADLAFKVGKGGRRNAHCSNQCLACRMV